MSKAKTVSLTVILLFPLLLLSQNHRLGWGLQLGNDNTNILWNFEIDTSGNIFILGTFEGSFDADPGPSTFFLNSDPGVNKLFLLKLDSSRNFQWAKEFFPVDGKDILAGKWLLLDAAGDIYLTGKYFDTVDADPGPGVYNLRPSSYPWDEHSFLIKLDSNGDFLWGHGSQLKVSSLEKDEDNFIYMCGKFFAGADHDPGPGDFWMQDREGEAFIQKIHPSGNLVWAKNFGGMSNGNFTLNLVSSLAIGPDKEVVISGNFSLGADFDPDTARYSVGPVDGNYDMYVLKLDSLGNFAWVNYVNSPYGESASAVAINSSGNVLMTGNFGGNSDFNPFQPGGELNGPRSAVKEDIFLLKYTKEGDFDWVKQIGGPTGRASTSASYIYLDRLENVYITGGFSSPVDFDPGPSTDIKGSNSRSAFIAKYDSAGNYFWTELLAAPMFQLIRSIEIDQDFNLYMAGSFSDTLDLDFGPNRYMLNTRSTSIPSQWDIFMGKWSPDSCLSFISGVDSIKDVSCLEPGYLSLFARGGVQPYRYNWTNFPSLSDSFTNIIQGGLQSITVADANNCEREIKVLLDEPQGANGIDFRVNMSNGSARAGFPMSIDLNASNENCTLSSSTLILTLNEHVRFDSASVAPDSISGDTLRWNLPPLSYDSSQFRIKVMTTVEVSAFNVFNFCFRAEIISDTPGEVYLGNNSEISCPLVLNSYDPNDIQVSPEGLCEEGFILNDQLLTYKIRFQNTGNADAINIFILDTLDANLDLNSLRVLSYSHEPMITEVLEDRILKFRFNNIYLPDSTTDEPNSHGYVIYEIVPKPNLAVGTSISNRAGIYFDFNEAVITNTVVNTLTDMLPSFDTEIQQDGSTLIVEETTASYQWIDCANENTPILGATNQSFSPEANGTFAVILTNGTCSEISACYTIANVGIDPDFQSEINYYPNPSTGVLHIDLGELYNNLAIEIINAMGQRVHQHTETLSDNISLDLPAQTGVYFIKLQAEGKRAVLKVLRK